MAGSGVDRSWRPTVVHSNLTWADIDATAAYALGPGAAEWLRHRVGRTGLAVGADGTTSLVPASNASGRPRSRGAR